jgi:hypothetical protein
MSEISNYPRRSIEVANANREVVHSRRWLAGICIANALFFVPLIAAQIIHLLVFDLKSVLILDQWQYALYGAILNVGFLTMPVIRLARITGRSVRWAIDRIFLIALLSLGYIGFIPICALYYKSRKQIEPGGEDALPHPAFAAPQ